ncbi:MAG: T9SS type A sorting domain-containing protein, partial [Bacteroidota bacterium]
LDFLSGSFELSEAAIAGAGTVDFSGTTTLDGSLGGLTGTMVVSGGTVALGQNESVPHFSMTNGTLQGPGALTIAGTFSWTFGTLATDLRLLASGSGSFASSSKTLGPGSTLRLDADTDWTGGQIVGGAGSTLDNNATLTSTTNNPLVSSGGAVPRPVFDNDGAFVYDNASTAANAFALQSGGTVEIRQGISRWSGGGTNTGLLRIDAGAEFDLSGPTVFTNAPSGTIGGDGTFDDPSAGSTSSFVNEGTFAPGASPGLLTYDGTYEMAASSVLAIEIGGGDPPVAGDDYDQLAVTGDAELGGTLRLAVAVGDAPAIGDVYTILTTTGTRSGTFDAVDGPFGYTFDVRYLTQSVEVEVLTVPNFDLAATNTDPAGDPIVVQKPGAIQFAYSITNNTTAPISGDVFFTASLGSTVLAQGVILSGTLPANSSSPALSFAQAIPGNTPNGTYTYAVKIGQFPNTVVGQVDFTVVVTSGSREAEGEETWAAHAAASWVDADGSLLMAAVETKADAETSETDLEAASAAVPETFGLAAAYPNPFRSATTLALDVPEAGRVTVAVYDALGRRVAVLLDEEVEAATHRVPFDASDLPSGVYLVRATGAGQAAMQRVTLVR